MKPLLYVILLGILVPMVSFAQTVQTGYAVITPIAGTGTGLSVTETFGELVGANFFQSSVIGSPLVTLTDVVVNIDPGLGLNTGVALVNPNNSPAVVTFTLGNQAGAVVDTRTLTLGARQQISMFVTEIFSGSPAVASPITGLMFINASLPIGVLGLSFNGFSFTSLPVATQITVATVNTVNGVNAVAVTNPTLPIITTVTNPPIVTSLGGAVSTSPIPTTITQIPATFPGLAGQQSGTTVTSPLTGVVPTGTITTVSPIVPVSTTATGLTGVAGVVTVTTPVTTIAGVAPTLTFPVLTVGIGGPGALLLPQVASGAGWVSQIIIANTSGIAQGVRVDFFTPFGAPFNLPFGSSVPNLVIAAGGVATITTNATVLQ